MKMSQELVKTAKYLTIAAEAIVKYFLGLPVRPSCIVLLGRDCWPLFPLLKRAGLPVQYFLYSRRQVGDLSTAQQWWAEVPRGALVVDTGYNGSILTDILRFDRSIQGVLLCSYSSWPQAPMPAQVSFTSVVQTIEEIPKLTGRAVGYTPSGVAIVGEKHRDADEVRLSLKETIHYNMLLCVLLGINIKWAWFTGVTPNERLFGVDKNPPIAYKNRPKWGGTWVCDCQGNLAIKYQVTRPYWVKDLRGYLNAVAADGIPIRPEGLTLHPSGYADYTWGNNKFFINLKEKYFKVEAGHVLSGFCSAWELT